MARFLSLFVAAVFAVSPFAIAWSLLPGDELTWMMGALALIYLVGATLLTVGSVRWYGSKPRRLRVWGFVLLLAGALVNVSLAFVLFPLVLLAAPGLRRHERANSYRGTAPAV